MDGFCPFVSRRNRSFLTVDTFILAEVEHSIIEIDLTSASAFVDGIKAKAECNQLATAELYVDDTVLDMTQQLNNRQSSTGIRLQRKLPLF